MIQEKLTAAFAYIRVWRAATYSALVLGCITALCCAIYGFGSGLIAFNSQFGAKKAAKIAQAAYAEQCEQNISQEQQNFKTYAKELPKRLDAITQKHEQELQQHRQQVQALSESIRQAVSDYNASASVTDTELQRLKNMEPSELVSLMLPQQDISTREKYNTYRQMVKDKELLLTQYRRKIQDKLMSEYNRYEEPVINKFHEIQTKVNELGQRIETIQKETQHKVEELEKRKRSIPSAIYSVRPEKNIYGSTDVQELDTILDISDTLPMMAATLSSAAPLTEDEQRKLRIRILNLSDWLPTYARTYTPTKSDIESVHIHNAEIDHQIAEVRREAQSQINLLTVQLHTEQRNLAHYQKRKNEMEKLKNQISKIALATTQKWKVSNATETLVKLVEKEFPSEPEALETKLQREKDLVPQKEEDMKQKIRNIEQDIVASEERLEQTLAKLSAVERKACALAMPPGLSFSAMIGICSWVGFCILLILADYMIAPLLCATKAQETAINTRAKENN